MKQLTDGAVRIVMAGPWNESTDSTFYRRVGGALVERGASVTYLADRRPTLRDPWDDFMAVEVWPTRSCRTISDVVWVTQRLRSLQPDLVHARFGSATATMLAAVFARTAARVRVVSSSPAALRHDWSGGLWGWRVKVALQIAMLRLPTDVVAMSPGHLEEIRRVYRLVADRLMEPLPFGVRDPQPAVARSGSVVCVARLTPAKGQHRLIEALAGTGLHLTLVGDGPTRTELAELARRLQVEVRFTGILNRDAVQEQLAAAKVSVLLTAGDALPLSIIESLAAGTPVVTTGASGPSFIVRDGVEGIIVDPDQPQLVRAAIQEVVGDRWNEYSAAARERYLDNFELETAAGRYADRLLRLATERKERRGSSRSK